MLAGQVRKRRMASIGRTNAGRRFGWAMLLSVACFGSRTMPDAAYGQSLVTEIDSAASPSEIAENGSKEIPPALETYMGRTIAVTMHYKGAPWLIRESRQREEDCTTMLRALGLKPGLTVCDMGCGNGFYSLKVAEEIGPEGRVLAVDIQQEMLRLLEERAKEAGVKNIELILGGVIDPRLPADKVDLILCVDVYHEFSHPEQMLAAMRKSLKPQGQLVLVEFRSEDPDVPILELHKMSKVQIMKELPANGFRLVREFDELPWQHMMFFERTE